MVIQVITRSFQLLDTEGRGELPLIHWRTMAQIPEAVEIFKVHGTPRSSPLFLILCPQLQDFFEIIVHRRQCIEPIPLQPGMWKEEVKRGRSNDAAKEGIRDMQWASRGVSDVKEYLCPDGKPVETVSVFDRMADKGMGIGGMIQQFIKQETSAKLYNEM